jgi:hypothetical protein
MQTFVRGVLTAAVVGLAFLASQGEAEARGSRGGSGRGHSFGSRRGGFHRSFRNFGRNYRFYRGYRSFGFRGRFYRGYRSYYRYYGYRYYRPWYRSYGYRYYRPWYYGYSGGYSDPGYGMDSYVPPTGCGCMRPRIPYAGQ